MLLTRQRIKLGARLFPVVAAAITHLQFDSLRSSLYAALERLLGRCLPHLEAAWSHGKQVGAFSDVADEDADNSDCSHFALTALLCFLGFGLSHLNVMRAPATFPGPSGEGEPEEVELESLRGRYIQVITKIVDYELPAGATHEGVWHVEGMSHENIVATAELILKKDSGMHGGDLQFQRGFRASEGGPLVMGFPQSRPYQLDEVVDQGLVPLGTLPLPRGRLAAWPNSHIHRVAELSNRTTSPALRRIVVCLSSESE